MIRDLSASDDRRLTAKCSVCVIGGGIAGLIAASRLSASGRRVIVLESGDRKPLDRFDAFNVVEQAGETYQTAVAGRVRALGGTSNTWGGRIMPLAPHDMASEGLSRFERLADREGRTRPLRPGNRTPVSVGSKLVRGIALLAVASDDPLPGGRRGYDPQMVEVADLSPAQCRPSSPRHGRDQAQPRDLAQCDRMRLALRRRRRPPHRSRGQEHQREAPDRHGRLVRPGGRDFRNNKAFASA